MLPVKKFMDDLYSLASSSSRLGINPRDDEEFIINNSVALEMKPLPKIDNWVHFISIRALEPGKGDGSRAMNKIIKLVDKNRIFLIGRINPYDTKIATKKDLQDWYLKYRCKPLDELDGIWIRSPEGVEFSSLPPMDSITKRKIREGLSDYDYAEKIFIKRIIVYSIVLTTILLIYRNKAFLV